MASPQINTAMILAAGLGKRMRPLTDLRPKPMIEVAGKALIDYNFDRLEEAGVTRAVVNVHYLADMLEAHLRARHSPDIAISDERAAILDSGGGVKKALALLGEGPFFSLNADTIWMDGPRSNLVRMAETFDPATMDILLLLAPTVSTVGWGNRGDLAMEQDGRLRWPRPGEVAPFAYCGAAILDSRLFSDTPDVFSLLLLFNRAMAAGRLFGLRLDGRFMHVGTPEAIVEAEAAIIGSSR
ncbi:MAG TPA: nucleotidyltransferase family protein [Beijerinckiaceae bacterium]|nr:nucleotidyltransferase family protein [Beijerinckiaceae bacterium]